MTIVYIIHGFIGAGKTTFAKKLEKETGAIRFTPDEIIAETYGQSFSYVEEDRNAHIAVQKEIWEKVEKLIKQEQDVIMDYGVWRKHQRTELAEKIKKAGGKPVFYEVLCELPIMRQRALARNNSGDIKITPERYDFYYKMLEPMDGNEERVTIRTDIVPPSPETKMLSMDPR